MIPKDFIQDLLARTQIVDIISPVVSLKKAGKEYKACCPFHKEKTPSFTVSAEKNFYHCFGCGKHGDPIAFLMSYQNLSYVEAIHALAERQGIAVPQSQSGPRENLEPLYNIHTLAADYFQHQLHNHPEASIAHQYLKNRGLDHTVIERFGIGFAPSGWDNFIRHATGHHFSIEQCLAAGLATQNQNNKTYDRFRKRIMFPIRDNRGRVIAFGGRVLDDADSPKYLNSPETPIFHKGHELYGIWEASRFSQSKDTIIVEGYMDVVALAQFGITGALATLGTATTPEHLQKCMRLQKSVIFCFDGDAAGKRAAWRALEISLGCLQQELNVRFLFLPDKEDPDTFVRKYGADALIQRLKQAISLSDFFFQHLSQDLNLNQLDQKAQLANQAAPLIQQIPDTILKELMLTTLSQMVNLPLNIIKEIKAHQPFSGTLPPAKPVPHAAKSTASNWRQPTVQKMPTPMRWMISLLVQTPTLYKCTPDVDALHNSPLPGASLFMQLLAHITTHQISDTATLFSLWPDEQTKKHLEICAKQVHCIPEAGLIEEYLGAIARAKEQHHRAIVQQYLTKARESGLNEDEKQVLNRTLQLLKQQELPDKSEVNW